MAETPRRILVLTDRVVTHDDAEDVHAQHAIFCALAEAGHEVVVATEAGYLARKLGRAPRVAELESEIGGIRIVHLCAPPQLSDRDHKALMERVTEVFAPDILLSAVGDASTRVLQNVAQKAERPVLILADRVSRKGKGELRSGRYLNAYATFFPTATAEAKALLSFAKNGTEVRTAVVADGVRHAVIPPRLHAGRQRHMVLAQPEGLGRAWRVLLVALRMLSRSGWDVTLELLDDEATSGPARRAMIDRLLETAPEYELEGRIRHRPYSGHGDLRKIYAQTDAALFLRDATGSDLPTRTILSAASAGAVPVLCDVPSLRPLAEDLGDIALVVPSMSLPQIRWTDISDLAERLVEALETRFSADTLVTRRDLAPLNWSRRVAPIRNMLEKLDAERAAATAYGVEGLEAHLRNETQGDEARVLGLMRISAVSVFVPNRPNLTARLHARIHTLAGTEHNLRSAFYGARKSHDLPLLLSTGRKMLELDPSSQSALALRAIEYADTECGEIIRLEDRLKQALQVPRVPATGSCRAAYMVHNALPLVSVGYATRTQGMAAAMVAQGLELTCITRPGFPYDMVEGVQDMPASWTVGDVTYRHVPAPRRDQSRIFRLEAIDAIKDELLRIGADCVVSASNHDTALPSLIAARELGLPFIYEVRGFWEITRLSREPDFDQTLSFKKQKLLESLTARHADRVLTLTQAMRSELITRGVEDARIGLVPNSADAETFAPRPRADALAARLGLPADVPVIGYIGSFVQYEGLDDLMEAAIALRAQGYDFRLLIVGSEGASEGNRTHITDELLSMAQRHGMDDWLIMPGRVPHEQVMDWYSLIDVAPFPRKPQPVTEIVSPLKPLEAMAMEKAVVVSGVGPLAEIAGENERGLVFKKGDPADMARQIARLLDEADLRATLGARARRWVLAERTWERIAGTMGDTIRELTLTER